jgi:hypothetical protein
MTKDATPSRPVISNVSQGLKRWAITAMTVVRIPSAGTPTGRSPDNGTRHSHPTVADRVRPTIG